MVELCEGIIPADTLCSEEIRLDCHPGRNLEMCNTKLLGFINPGDQAENYDP